MFGWLNKKIVNPVGLDSSLAWLNIHISEAERVEAANKIAFLCFTASMRNKTEGIDLQYFIKSYKEASDEAMAKYNNKEATLTEAAFKYVAFAFVLLLKNFNEHPDAKTNMHKILIFMETNASESMFNKLSSCFK